MKVRFEAERGEEFPAIGVALAPGENEVTDEQAAALVAADPRVVKLEAAPPAKRKAAATSEGKGE